MAGASLDEVVAIKPTQSLTFQRLVWRSRFGNRYNRIQLVAVVQVLQHEHINLNPAVTLPIRGGPAGATAATGE